MTDSHQYVHGKRFAVYGDPDYLVGYVSFLLEMGAKPVHVLSSKGSKKLEKGSTRCSRRRPTARTRRST